MPRTSPKIIFLETPAALAEQVAMVLMEGVKGCPVDLTDTQVVIPTAGAGRRIRFALAKRAVERRTGVLPPRFLQPMQALLPAEIPVPVANRVEREGAWAQVIQHASREEISAVLPREKTTVTERARMGIGALICEVCDLLAEAGHDPGASLLETVCEGDAARWEQLRPLYQKYLRLLKVAGLADPNDLRVAQIKKPMAPPGVHRLVVACIPDLPAAFVKFADALAGKGVRVEILVWKPGEMGGGFDAWGRPLREEWSTCPIAVESHHIAIARESSKEAKAAVAYLAESDPPGDYALVLADQTLEPAFSAEILRAGRAPFRPEGRRLIESEAAVVAVEWMGWLVGRDLRKLRTLLERPHFNRWLGRMTDLAASQLLAVCEFLIEDLLAETLDQARAALASRRLTPDEKAVEAEDRAGELVAALDGIGEMPFPKLIRQAWAGSSDHAGAALRVLEIWDGISASPIFNRWIEGQTVAFTRALMSEVIFESTSDGAVELSGWLEAPWIEASRLAICGCVEGRLPGSVNEHAFLPDSKRKALGILDNDARLARDSYLLTCLLNVHGGNLHLSFSRFGEDGSPALPSRLLLRCAESELPGRVLAVFEKSAGEKSRPRAANGWRWSLPNAMRRAQIKQISPSGLREYLACPFRFYLSRILHLKKPDPDAREMDALRFGTLLHAAVEAFGRTAPLEGNPAKIEKIVLGTLEAEAGRLFGPDPAPAVRVQLEALKVRLRVFARVQAEEFAAGWRILDVERPVKPDGPSPLMIGPLALSAKIDRIEEHPKHGLRILDYKTSASKKGPAMTHLGSASADGILDEARVMVGGREKCWVDLQLPVYRHIAESLYPGRPVQVAYFALPADSEGSGVLAFDLTDELFASARACAEAVTERVHRGVFWPPRTPTGSWDDPYAAFFLNGPPEKCFDADTIKFLEGRS